MSGVVFDPSPPETLNRLPCVLFHEIGHALVWFASGEAVGTIRLKALGEPSTWAGSCPAWPRVDGPESLADPSFWSLRAERALAGDIAGRKRHGNLPLEVISADGLRSSGTLTPDAIISMLPDGHDLRKAVELSRKAVDVKWLDWLNERHRTALSIVEEYWDEICARAVKIEKGLPKDAISHRIYGTDVIDLFRKAHVPCAKSPPVEVVYNDDQGPFWVKLRRFVRKFGENGVLNRYEHCP